MEILVSRLNLRALYSSLTIQLLTVTLQPVYNATHHPMKKSLLWSINSERSFFFMHRWKLNKQTRMFWKNKSYYYYFPALLFRFVFLYSTSQNLTSGNIKKEIYYYFDDYKRGLNSCHCISYNMCLNKWRIKRFHRVLMTTYCIRGFTFLGNKLETDSIATHNIFVLI